MEAKTWSSVVKTGALFWICLSDCSSDQVIELSYFNRGMAMNFHRINKTMLAVALVSGLAANMAMAQYTLEVTVDPTSSGLVSAYPDATEYEEGEVVTLTATAADGYQFAGWSGDVTASESTLTIVMTDDTALTATFEEATGEYTLTAYVDPSGAGTLVRDPAKTGYDSGEEVTITAYAGEGYIFTGWQGDIPDGADYTEETLTLTITGDTSVKATFAAGLTLDDSNGTTPGEWAPCGSAGFVSLSFLFSMMLSMKLSRCIR